MRAQKLLLTLGTFAIISTPIFISVSCSSTDTPNVNGNYSAKNAKSTGYSLNISESRIAYSDNKFFPTQVFTYTAKATSSQPIIVWEYKIVKLHSDKSGAITSADLTCKRDGNPVTPINGATVSQATNMGIVLKDASGEYYVGNPLDPVQDKLFLFPWINRGQIANNGNGERPIQRISNALMNTNYKCTGVSIVDGLVTSITLIIKK